MRTIYLFCGGMSRRMGRDKVLLPMGEQTLIEYQISKCRNIFNEIVLLSGSRRYQVGCRHLFDKVQNAGPLSGLLAALEDVHTRQHVSVKKGPEEEMAKNHRPDHGSHFMKSASTVVVMAVDLPGIRRETLQWLASVRIPDGTDAMIARSADHATKNPAIQPLLGIYHQRTASKLHDYLSRGHRSVKGFLEKINSSEFSVPVEEIQNINTETEYLRLISELNGKNH